MSKEIVGAFCAAALVAIALTLWMLFDDDAVDNIRAWFLAIVIVGIPCLLVWGLIWSVL